MPLSPQSLGCSGGGCTGANDIPDLSVIWILLCSFFIMSMQLGFAMLEVGSVRQAHRLTVLAKNILDSAVATIAFAAYNEWNPNSLTYGKDGYSLYHLVTLHSAFCATSVTITSGSMAERTHMLAYLGHAAVMAGIMYPTVATSVWGQEGILHSQFHERFHRGFRFHDFAGGGVVHLVGGCAALAGNVLLGRRIMQPPETFQSQSQELATTPPELLVSQSFDEVTAEHMLIEKPHDGWLRRFDRPNLDSVEFQGVAYLQVMGMFVLWVSWYAFNSAFALSILKSGELLAALLAWNTSMAAVGGCLGGFIFCMLFRPHLEVGVLVNSTLSGLVAITSCCDVATSRSSLCIGSIAGFFIYPTTRRLMDRLYLDDPVDAIPVHWAAGLFGLISGAFCRPDCQYYTGILGVQRKEQLRFCANDWDVGKQLLAQVWGVLTICGWVGGISGIVWSVFALSECTRSKEVVHIQTAIDLLGDILTPSLVEEKQAQFKAAASRSTLVRKILRRHGWSSGGWQAGTPQSPSTLQRKLQVAKNQYAETTLETKIMRILSPLASLLHRCALVRELAFLRLRIAPAHELSGLGAASADGGKIALAMQHAVMLLTVKNRQQMVHSPLRREVQELSLTVQSQEVLLQTLMRSGRFRSGVAQWREKRRDKRLSLQSVQEQQGQATPFGHGHRGEQPTEVPHAREYSGDSGSLFDLRPVFEQSQSADDVGRLLLRAIPPNFPRSISSHSTDRTLSDRSAGLLSPSSVLGETPPPSIIGQPSQSRRSRRSALNPVSSAGGGNPTEDVASQLLTVLRAQHQLWTTLQSATPTSGSVGSRTPDTPQQFVQQQTPELHRLQAAIQRVHSASPLPPHRAETQTTTRAI